MRFVIGFTLLLSGALSLSGCLAIKVNPNNMEVVGGAFKAQEANRKQLAVGRVTVDKSVTYGGIEDGFHSALAQSLSKYDMLAPDQNSSEMVVNVDILQIKRVKMIPSITDVAVRYRVLERGTEKMIFEETIRSKFTAEVNMKGLGSMLMHGRENANDAKSAENIDSSQLNEKEFAERIEAIGYAKSDTPIAAYDGTKRESFSVEGALRKNIAYFMQRLNGYEIYIPKPKPKEGN